MAGKYEKWITEEGLLMIQGWIKDGLTDEQIASNIGISRNTIRVWRQRFPELEAVMRKSKAIVDQQVENALFKKAIGYFWVEETRKLDDDGNLIVVQTVTRHVPPDTTAQIFWLKNRKPEEWRDRKEVGLSASTKEQTDKMDDMLKQLGMMPDE